MREFTTSSGGKVKIDESEEVLNNVGLNLKPGQEIDCSICNNSHHCVGIIKGLGKGGCNGGIDVVYMSLEDETGITWCHIENLKQKFSLK